jgi:CRISPR-associated protein Csx10
VSELTLTLAQPAQLGDRARKDFVLSTMEYVPGAVVRGAFAAAWLAKHGPSTPGTPERKQFRDLFEGGVRFGALLRPGTEFMSLAVVGHKYDPTDGCEIVDYDRAMSDNDPPPYCPQCGSPIEQRRGLHGQRPAPDRRTSVAIGEDGVARDGQLFTRELLQAGQGFHGTLTATEDQQVILKQLGPLRIGGRRTTHGLADIVISDGGTPPTAQRRPDGKLVIRLRTPAIFTDDHGRPTREPSPSALHAALGIPASVGIEVVNSWTRWDQTGGWHAASGLPKPQELTVAAGSTYLIQIQSQDHPERVHDDTSLAKLGATGLGLRRHEGFGDLAPPPILRPGKAQHDAKATHLRDVTDRTAPLRGLPVQVSAQAWQVLLTLMGAHADGDAQAAQRLHRFSASQPDKAIREAMAFFLGLPPQDARHVVAGLSQ